MTIVVAGNDVEIEACACMKPGDHAFDGRRFEVLEHVTRTDEIRLRDLVLRDVCAFHCGIVGQRSDPRRDSPIQAGCHLHMWRHCLDESRIAATDLDDGGRAAGEEPFHFRDEPVVFLIGPVLFVKLLIVFRLQDLLCRRPFVEPSIFFSDLTIPIAAPPLLPPQPCYPLDAVIWLPQALSMFANPYLICGDQTAMLVQTICSGTECAHDCPSPLRTSPATRKMLCTYRMKASTRSMSGDQFARLAIAAWSSASLRACRTMPSML